MRKDLKPIEPRITKQIVEAGFKAMRDSRTGLLLDVSATTDGLMWSLDRKGSLLYYKNAKLKHYQHEGILLPSIEGEPDINPRIVIQDFIPKDHWRKGYDGDQYLDPRLQKAEYRFTDKAFRLLGIFERYQPNTSVKQKLRLSTMDEKDAR